mmetsp:Transcript_17171/g.39665  ORF Transcript_17171/g.39665 Transcript_17171/m.39665 type:complete len:82 (-) Transcript_17171:223-468(-)
MMLLLISVINQAWVLADVEKAAAAAMYTILWAIFRPFRWIMLCVGTVRRFVVFVAPPVIAGVVFANSTDIGLLEWRDKDDF